jgi:hypothetical protein
MALELKKKSRLNRLEKSVGKQLLVERLTPAIWRSEGVRIAIQKSPLSMIGCGI